MACCLCVLMPRSLLRCLGEAVLVLVAGGLVLPEGKGIYPLIARLL